ncbi:MAG: hypothetical protein RIQ71_221 [Verrucomicrobiota bacterium]|jgi:ABC-type polysaccharide/polyol phosphate export permease
MSPTTSIAEAFRQWRIWWWLARRDIRSRYRGSVLGPLWLVATLGILVGGLSIVYGAVFNQPLKTFIPYLTTGFMVWWFVSVSITECCTAFINNSALIRNQPLPIAIYVLQTIARNLIILATNIIVFLAVALFCGLRPSLINLFVIPGLVLVSILLFSVGLCLAIICARFRDIPHLVANLLQVAMLLTPIMFLKSMLGPRAAFADFNPFFHIVDAIRGPLLGQTPSALTWSFLVLTNLFAAAASAWLMRRAGHRVAYLV